MRRLISKYLKSEYLTYFITLVNIVYLFHFVANNYVVYKQGLQKEITAFEIFLYAASVLIVAILVAGGFIFLSENESLEHLSKKIYTSTSELAENTVLAYDELQNGNLVKEKIYGFHYVTELEKSISKGQEIWIISGDIEEDTQNQSLVDVIGDNLDRGVIYRFMISKVNGEITDTANTGKQKLEQNYSDHLNKNLFILEIQYELVAPDVDIIIYDATAPKADSRKGFVCIEIGQNNDSYSYQKLSTDQVIKLQKQISGLHGKTIPKKIEKSTASNTTNSSIKEIVQVIYWFITACLYAVFAIKKTFSINITTSTVIIAIALWLITIAALEFIDSLVGNVKTYMDTIDNNRRIYTNIIKEPEVSSVISKKMKEKETIIYDQMHLGSISDIVKVKDDCDCIWILSDLSHDIASEAFRNWITHIFSEHGKMKCRIIYPQNTLTEGRIFRVKGLISDCPGKIECKKLNKSSVDEASHYMWSQTYGILFFSNSNSEHQLYISLGTAEVPLYKAVNISEAEAAAVNGTLESFWGKAHDIEL